MNVWKRMFGLVALFLGVQLFVSLLGRAILYPDLKLDNDDSLVLSVFLFLSNLLVLCILFSGKILPFRSTFRNYSWNFREMLFFTGMVLLSVIPVNGLTELLHLPDFMEVSFLCLMNEPLGILNIVVLGPLVEELIFRKGLLDIMHKNQYTLAEAVFFSALIFSMVHGNPAQIPGAFLFGLLLGWIYWRTGSVWIVWLMHAINNLIGVVSYFIWGADQSLTELLGFWGLILMMCCSSILLGLLLWVYQRRITIEEK